MDTDRVEYYRPMREGLNQRAAKAIRCSLNRFPNRTQPSRQLGIPPTARAKRNHFWPHAQNAFRAEWPERSASETRDEYRTMAWRPIRARFTTTPSRREVDVRAIRLLPRTGWRLISVDELPIVGTVPKDYLAYGNPNSPGTLGYIAKKGRMRADARECVTEEIISKIGSMLPLRIARSELVRVTKTDVRFLSRNFVVRGQHELLHGIELVAKYFETNPAEVVTAFDLKDKNAEHRFYTINNILMILDSLFPVEIAEIRKGFFEMIAFDAFIGAPDRHAMNWGVLAPLKSDIEPVRYAPIFDTARGLFRECSDRDLLDKERNQGRNPFLDKYAERSRPIFSTGGLRTENHFSLVNWISANCNPEDHRAMCTVFDSVDIPSIETMLQRKFRRIITQVRIGFIIDLLSLRIDRLQKEVHK